MVLAKKLSIPESMIRGQMLAQFFDYSPPPKLAEHFPKPRIGSSLQKIAYLSDDPILAKIDVRMRGGDRRRNDICGGPDGGPLWRPHLRDPTDVRDLSFLSFLDLNAPAYYYHPCPISRHWKANCPSALSFFGASLCLCFSH